MIKFEENYDWKAKTFKEVSKNQDLFKRPGYVNLFMPLSQEYTVKLTVSPFEHPCNAVDVVTGKLTYFGENEKVEPLKSKIITEEY